METENGNRGANVKSTCLEAAESLGRTGKGGFAETGIFRRCLSWGAGEEAAHSHLRVEGLLFHGDLCVMKQWCVEYRCFFCEVSSKMRLVGFAHVNPVRERNFHI